MEFTNQERVRFFKRLTAGIGRALLPGSVNEIEIRLDGTSGTLPNDARIAWMKDAVQRLKVDGDRLNDVFLISDEGCYSYYFIHKMDVTYAYTFGANAGTCQVTFSFSSPGRSETIEGGVMRLSPAQLSALLEGLKWTRVHARRVPRPTATQ